MEVVLGLFLVTLAAVLGGLIAKVLKLPSLVGYILAGIIFGVILPSSVKDISSLAEVGTILLLFSIGIELSFDSLSRYLKTAVVGALIQVVLVSFFGFIFLSLFGISLIPAIILSIGFSASSTAVMVKILSDKGEIDTIHGEILLGWLLVQDLLVIPVMIIMPILMDNTGNWYTSVGFSFIKALVVIFVTVVLGKLIIPFLIHKVTDANSRELLLLSSFALALGTAVITSFFGISPALGAFLAGVVISESQEHHAIFAETRPLRDLFMALFFVTLGFMANPAVIIANIILIITIAVLLIIIKIVVVFGLNVALGYRGKTAIAVSFGLAQVGEFAFVIFSTALGLKLISQSDISIGIGVTLITLIISPILYGSVMPFWRKVKFINIFKSVERNNVLPDTYQNHIVICGYGRVGKWVGRALADYNIPFVVVEYNQKIVQELKTQGISVIYGDPTEPEVLEAVSIRGARAIVIAIPDRIAQETLIAYVQTVAPNVKIISRAHLDSDWDKLKILRVNKIVQPEFEASIEIVRSILRGIGKSKDEISGSVKSLRVSHSQNRS